MTAQAVRGASFGRYLEQLRSFQDRAPAIANKVSNSPATFSFPKMARARFVSMDKNKKSLTALPINLKDG